MSSSYGAGVAVIVEGNVRSAFLQYLVANASRHSSAMHFPARCASGIHWPSDLLLVPGLVVTWCLA